MLTPISLIVFIESWTATASHPKIWWTNSRKTYFVNRLKKKIKCATPTFGEQFQAKLERTTPSFCEQIHENLEWAT